MKPATSVRPPSSEIPQWDKMACETACTAQLLHMHGRLDVPFDTRAFDRRIGRRPGQTDLENGNLRVIFEEGFDVVTFSSVDLERAVADSSYIRDRWVAQGCTKQDADAALPRVYPQVRARALRKLTLIKKHSQQYRCERRDPTWADAAALVGDGYFVGGDLAARTGTSHRVLIVQTLGRDTYQVFWPGQGLLEMDGRDELEHMLLPGIEGYRLR